MGADIVIKGGTVVDGTGAPGYAADVAVTDGVITAIGHSPTALVEVINLIEEGIKPALIIGVPVGFISTVESKEALLKVTTVPWITTVGRKGGSTVAVAIVNALLRLAANAPAQEVVDGEVGALRAAAEAAERLADQVGERDEVGEDGQAAGPRRGAGRPRCAPPPARGWPTP